jgi:hypothetical protein
MVQEGSDVFTEEAWRRFVAFRESATGVDRTILMSRNPEVVLSLPDLWDAALEADNRAIEADTSIAIRKLRQGLLSDADVKAEAMSFENRYASVERAPLMAGRKARRDFLHVLNVYLSERHYNDALAENRPARDALRTELGWLRKGDCVITTNWDTATERTLLEMGRWTPSDGYGFPIELVNGVLAHEMGRIEPVPEWVPQASDIRVLKLHGSYGWLCDRPHTRGSAEDRDVYLDYSQFLSMMPFVNGDDRITSYDRRKPHGYSASAEPLYFIPSYLKQLSGTSIQRVWYEADRSLAQATEVRIVGSSLPEADVALRVLLNSMRFRLIEGSLHTTLCDPALRTHEAWRDFLGDRLTTVIRKAGEAT